MLYSACVNSALTSLGFSFLSFFFGSKNGVYLLSILAYCWINFLAETKELKQMDKGTHVPPIHASDLEDAGKDDDAQTSRKTTMQVNF